MTEFWESNFIDKKEMWGWEPAKSALLAKQLFVDNKAKSVLIPGFGYGRNARVFSEAGMSVTGIEISETAIKMARKHFEDDLVIYHGSVNDMPFDNNFYDGIFCYALIHLLDEDERAMLIRNCYNQLNRGGHMVFAFISKEAHTYGKGQIISKNRFELFTGVKMFFYDRETVENEFGNFGLLDISAIDENYPFYLAKCRK